MLRFDVMWSMSDESISDGDKLSCPPFCSYGSLSSFDSPLLFMFSQLKFIAFQFRILNILWISVIAGAVGYCIFDFVFVYTADSSIRGLVHLCAFRSSMKNPN